MTGWCLSGTSQAQDVYLCVWRNPERTMTRIFPDARDYRTVTVPISDHERETIESIIKADILPGQREQFQYFEMIGKSGEIIGYIIAVTQKGLFGAVEFVFGLDTGYTVVDLYIQRARERDQYFKKREFLDLFPGVKVTQAATVKGRYSGLETPGTNAVLNGMVKALVSFERLVLHKK
jgi:hypothetical protein